MIKYSGEDLTENFIGKAMPPHYFLDEAARSQIDRNQHRARIILNEGLHQHPGHARLWHEYARSLRHNRGWDGQTLRCLEKAYKIAPKDMHIAMDLASFLVRKQQYDRAEKIHMAMLADEGENPRLLCAMGHNYQIRGKWPLALACFSRAVELDTTDEISLRRYKEIKDIAGRPVNDNDHRTLAQRAVAKGGIPAPAAPKEDIDNHPSKRP